MSVQQKDRIEKLYHDMYSAMIRKDRAELEHMHADVFELVHMTGLRQSKQVYISSIMDGTLNYFDERTRSLDIKIDGDRASMVGHSFVTAAVFGGGKHTWRLVLDIKLEKFNNTWKLTHAVASVF